MIQRTRRVEAIQLLRGLAAATVAIGHLTFAFADHIGPGLGVPRGNGLAGQAAVCVFFVISGYVMVVSTRGLAGTPGAVRLFWIRRCVRILPSWWIASVLLGLVFLWLGRSIEPRAFVLSLLLWPHAAEGFAGRPVLFLWPGWTLFYEMAFYFLFGLALATARVRVALIVASAIGALVIGGLAFDPEMPALFSVTRPVLLLFLAGVLLATWRERGHHLGPALRWLCLAAALGAVVAIPPAGSDALGFDYLAWAGLPAVLVCLAAFGGPLRLPLFALVDRFGDISFAVYLLHVPIAHLWIDLFPLRLGAWAFLLSATSVVFAVSLAFFLFVEAPLTRSLNRALGGRAGSDARLERTGV